MLRRTFQAMGTEVELLLDARSDERAECALACAEVEFERLEQVMSRFRESSELSHLNREGVVEASVDLARVVKLSLEAREASGGLFDPTIHDALVAAGYDRTFAELRIETPTRGVQGARCGGQVHIDGLTITLAPGTRIDLGGIGKGYAVDRIAAQLAMVGPCLVNAGGDLAVRGGAWPIGISDDLTVELTHGAIATSGRDRRSWRRNGEELHHLIDPTTSRPAKTDLLRVTVVAGSAVEAEMLAKIAFLGGDVDVPRVLFLADGSIVLAGGLA